MRRIITVFVFPGLMWLPTAGITGCGGTESGTQQISQKAAPTRKPPTPMSKSANHGRDRDDTPLNATPSAPAPLCAGRLRVFI